MDNVSTFTSRGPARGGTMLKPDITAPGDTILSTSNRTGNQGENISGTSMAAPHIAGVMALLREIHPDWTVAELKALAMNTATNDLFTGPSLTGNKYTPTRVGAGRVNVPNAASSNVIAYYKNNPGQVNISFGSVEVVNSLTGVDKTIVKSITLSNMGGASESYNVTFDSRYLSATNPGLTFTLLSAGNVAISNPVTVPAYGTVEIKVQVSLDAALLTRARDKTIATGRERFSEGGGYVVMTSTGSSPMVRVPVHIAARPASNMGVAETSITLPAAEIGTLSLTPSGIPVDTVDDGSLVYISELMGESPNDTWSTFSNNAADLKYIGAISDFTSTVVGKAAFFSIATHGDWDTLSAVEFDIYIDTNEDGFDDYVLYNTNTGGTDTMVSVLCSIPSFVCGIEDFINWWRRS
ncbi:MAG: S8 family serine peptidase [Anaerolineales bacterium]|nr:S8 family serine peptidase [Anaerolineales bacterium]